MDVKGLLNQLLSSGTDLAKQGQGMAEKGLNLPASGGERDAMLSGLGKGALAGGALSLLLGTKHGRKLGGTALQVGSAAALGGLAFKAYKDWKSKENNTGFLNHTQTEAQPAQQIEDKRSLLVLKSMIAAAKADGHVDDAEKTRIQTAVQSMGATDEVNRYVQQELDKPLDPADIAKDISNEEEAAEVYLASLLVADEQNFMEKAYLKELAKQLKLEDGLISHLEAQVKTA